MPWRETSLMQERIRFVRDYRQIYVSSALAGEWLGLEEIDDGTWAVRFCDIELGRYDERHHRLATPTPSAHRRGRGALPPGPPV